MEEFYQLVIQYAVFPIAVLCFGVGYVIKHYIPKIPNRFIPLILAIIGLVLNHAFNGFAFTFEIIVGGVGSGLIATGSFEAIRNLAMKQKDKTE